VTPVTPVGEVVHPPMSVIGSRVGEKKDLHFEVGLRTIVKSQGCRARRQ
jgi:hypothetical protein